MRKYLLFALTAFLVVVSCKKNDLKTVDTPTEVSMAQSRTDGSGPGFFQRCAAHEVLQRQIAANPERGRRLEELERFIQEKISQGKGKPPGTGGGGGGNGGGSGSGIPTGGAPIYSIPVVVHVVLKDPSIVSQTQINSQIAVLNRDFQRKNTELQSSVYLAGYDPNSVADCQIEFTLADVVTKATTVSSFGTNDAVKFDGSGGSTAVDPTGKLNLWVCDLSSGLLGYAQFPGGSSSTDGVVIDYQAFGTTASYPMYSSYRLGRTATHEIGHWLDLRHIWGDVRCGNDRIDDTPPQSGPNYGCPSTKDRSTCYGTTTFDMWMNYMDYTDDACMYMFTSGQKAWIDGALASARDDYVTTISNRYVSR